MQIHPGEITEAAAGRSCDELLQAARAAMAAHLGREAHVLAMAAAVVAPWDSEAMDAALALAGQAMDLELVLQRIAATCELPAELPKVKIGMGIPVLTQCPDGTWYENRYWSAPEGASWVRVP